MKATYQEPRQAESFGGVDALYRTAHGKCFKEKIQEWLTGVDAYTLHEPVLRHFPTNLEIVRSIDQQWQADLADMISLRQCNDGFRYILTSVDILSKYAWAVPLNMKRGQDIVKVFETFFSER